MRWLKHLTVAHQDVALAEILEEFGPEGYGIYWLILEHLAVTVERDSLAVPMASHSVVRWSQICHCSARRFRNFTQRAAELLLIECRSIAELKQFGSRSEADRLQIAVPKLLKYRDEYSKKSGQCTSQSRWRVDGDREQRESRGKSAPAVPPPAPEKPPADATTAALQRMHETHPYPSNPLDALYQFQRTVETAVNPEAVRESSEKNHAAWCEYWRAKTTQEGRAPWIPTLAQFFLDGYHAKMPPIRDGPAPVKQPPKSKSERDADAAREQFERLSRERSKANEPRVSANR